MPLAFVVGLGFAGVLVVGCGLGSETAAINTVIGAPEETTLELGVATCNATLTTEVVEAADTVTITVTAEDTTTFDCQDSTEVVLDEPLGQRQVIDGSTGEVVALTPPE